MNQTTPLPKYRNTIPLFLLGLGLILIVVSAIFVLRDASPQTDLAVVPVKVEFSAPEVTLSDTRNMTHSLSDYRGQVVLVNLWATWCPPCKAEMPALQSFYEEYKDQAFTIIAINDGDPAQDVLQFEKDYQLSFPIWLDPEYYATEKAFKTLNLPSSFVIDRNGVVRLSWVGGIDRKTLEKYVTPIIQE